MPALLEFFEDQPGATDTLQSFRASLEKIKKTKATLDRYVETKEGLDSDIAQLQGLFSGYVASCGVDNVISDKSQVVSDVTIKVRAKLGEYSEQVKELASLRRNLYRYVNANEKTAQITKQYEANEELSKELAAAKDEASTAAIRDKVVETRGDVISFQQTWGYLGRPMRRMSIPIFIVLALLFATAGIIGLYYLSVIQTEASMLQNPIIMVGMLLTIIFIILKFAKQI
jgi:hypothetical protein